MTRRVNVVFPGPAGPLDTAQDSPATVWWMHPEAVARLDALWRAWEHLGNDPATGMSVWWRDHADHHMGVLMSPDGPFRKSTGTIDLGEPLRRPVSSRTCGRSL